MATLLSPVKIPEVVVAQHAGSDYNDQVQSKRCGHKLGSPHIHKAAALAEQQTKDLAEGSDVKLMEAIVELMNNE